MAIFAWELGRKERRAENALKIKLCHNTYYFLLFLIGKTDMVLGKKVAIFEREKLAKF